MGIPNPDNASIKTTNHNISALKLHTSFPQPLLRNTCLPTRIKPLPINRHVNPIAWQRINTSPVTLISKISNKTPHISKTHFNIVIFIFLALSLIATWSLPSNRFSPSASIPLINAGLHPCSHINFSSQNSASTVQRSRP